jgi:squalene-hopene/tetraprenyl-beta-curcumene cyclase
MRLLAHALHVDLPSPSAARRCATAVLLAAAVALCPAAGLAAEPAGRVGPDPELYQQTVDKAVTFLTTRVQNPDGSYTPEAGIGPTALITTALMQHGRGPNDPTVARSLKYLEGSVRPDGGIYQMGTFYRNYETCLAILCFNEANRDGRYDKLLARAEAFIKGIQWDESEDKDESDFEYGGAGYGRNKRPDLSNTAFLIDALHALGRGPEDEAMQRALIFVSRTQNLETEHNTTPFAPKNPNGGFYYTPAAGGQSMAGETPGGGLRSYASMTYAGLKSMIYAGVGKDDPRVKAATEWIRRHYDLASNPGMGQAGLYYYYHVFAKALSAMGVDEFTDASGKAHDWRAELTAALAERQRDDGSWINENDRWMEGNPALVTGFALLALHYCRPQEK